MKNRNGQWLQNFSSASWTFYGLAVINCARTSPSSRSNRDKRASPLPSFTPSGGGNFRNFQAALSPAQPGSNSNRQTVAMPSARQRNHVLPPVPGRIVSPLVQCAKIANYVLLCTYSVDHLPTSCTLPDNREDRLCHFPSSPGEFDSYR